MQECSGARLTLALAQALGLNRLGLQNFKRRINLQEDIKDQPK
jgi:hypothetical protein